jgi:formylglycine-generating enzyme required for sulfatase activity
LPSTSQWDRAAGWYKGGHGPIQGPIDAIPTKEEVAYDRLEMGPLPVGKATRDVSPWGCRDMAANGLEWTRNIRFGAAETEVLDEAPPKDTRMLVRGRSLGELKPPIFADYESYLREERTKGVGEKFFDSRYDLSFRVVMETLP